MKKELKELVEQRVIEKLTDLKEAPSDEQSGRIDDIVQLVKVLNDAEKNETEALKAEIDKEKAEKVNEVEHEKLELERGKLEKEEELERMKMEIDREKFSREIKEAEKELWVEFVTNLVKHIAELVIAGLPVFIGAKLILKGYEYEKDNIVCSPTLKGLISGSLRKMF